MLFFFSSISNRECQYLTSRGVPSVPNGAVKGNKKEDEGKIRGEREGKRGLDELEGDLRLGFVSLVNLVGIVRALGGNVSWLGIGLWEIVMVRRLTE